MVNPKRELLAAVTAICLASAGAFAQKRGDDNKRPPKEPNKVVAGDKRGEKPPQNNNQRDKDRGGDKKGKP